MKGDAEEFGPYVVYEQIGLGGMATVHRAETQGLAGFSKQIALKRMLPGVAADASLVQSFIREARLASHLRHANVAQTYDLGKVGDTYFIAMELVPGRNLRVILEHCAKVAGPMPLPIAMNIVNQIADALDYAHNLCDETGQLLGIIHRDVSPSNVIVGEGGVCKLIDFGIAKATGGGLQTRSGTIKGKFSYIAPECLLGHVDARSDLFALGVIAHELLTNRPLFQARDDMDTLRRVKDMPIVPPSRLNPNVPAEIDSIVMTALARDPDRRWQRATAMREALTTETQRLGLVALDTQVGTWIESVFHHSIKDVSEPSIVISRNSGELARGSGTDELLEPTVEQRAYTQRQRQPTFDAPTVVAEVDRRLLAESARTGRNEEATVRVAVVPAPALPLMPPGIATTTEAAVNAPPVRLTTDVGSVLDDLEQRSSVSVRPADVARDAGSRARLGNFLLALLVLIAAGGAAAVVYFALP